MPLHVAVVMDPIGSIRIAKDTTFAMLLEAQRRGHRLHYVSPAALASPAASGRADGAAAGARRSRRLVHPGRAPCGRWAAIDVVLMRTDPPVDAEYLHDTHVLSLAQAAGVLVVNDPQGLRDLNEKLAALLSRSAARRRW